MPKFPKTFGRRKSTANQIEESADSPAVEHSFKVFERPNRGGNSFDGGVKFAKVAASSPGRLHVEDDNMFENLPIGKNRGSGASNTNTISTTDNSSRLSAASTAPSSTDSPAHNEWRSPHDKPFSDIPLPPVPRTSSGFSLRNAGRAMSWGRHKTPSPNTELQSPTTSTSKNSTEDEAATASRTRAVTASSYASTAVPPKLEENNLGLSLGGDFSDMFAGFGKRKSVILEQETNRALSRSPDALPSGPAARNNTRSNNISPINIDRNKEVEASPYSWSSQHSREGLMSSVSPPPFAPKDDPPPVPQHGTSRTITANPASFARPQKAGTLDNGLKRSSGPAVPRRQSSYGDGEAVDEDARLLRESANASRRMNEPGYSSKVRDSWALPSTSNHKVDDATLSSWGTGSHETTPRAKKAEPRSPDDNMFDSQFAASAQLAQRFQERSLTPQRTQGPQPKVMTPAQFERYKQDQERIRSLGGKPADDGDEDEDEAYDDEEDDAERAKQLAKQRRKQEAHMAVYRQQMMKVTGEALGTTPRPNMFASQSSPNLMNIGRPEENEEEDEEVPLAILQAHGFPSKSKPQMRSMGSNPNLRSSTPSNAGGVVDPRLPVFARNLPQDPYYGASIVHPSHRESMAFAGGAPSVAAGPSRGLPPGGLVGVIATEERSRAMRRGSPGPNGEYPTVPPPSNGFNGMGLPPSLHVTQSSGSIYNGMGGAPMGGMLPMMTPGDQAQIQMSQQMQQFMQMQMQFMQMMTAGGQQPPQSQNGHMSHPSMQLPRPGSTQHQRSLTILDPNAAPWMAQRGSTYAPSAFGGGGYAPSIAPSERSNIGLPGRYRPVSQMPAAAPDRSSTFMSGGVQQNWEKHSGNATVKMVKPSKAEAEDEDDEEGWEEMAKKREKKKSMWRTKKGGDSGNGLKDMLHLS